MSSSIRRALNTQSDFENAAGPKPTAFGEEEHTLLLLLREVA